jgi:threonine dehydratase
MPEATPIVKQVATRAYGGEVILHGRTFDEAYHRALDIARQKNSHSSTPLMMSS